MRFNSAATDSERGRYSTLTQREGLTARALVGNDPAVPTVPSRQTILKDGDPRETGPATEHAGSQDHIRCNGQHQLLQYSLSYLGHSFSKPLLFRSLCRLYFVSVKKHQDIGMLPLECCYLSRQAMSSIAGQQPQLVKYFALKRKPKSAALRADILQKCNENFIYDILIYCLNNLN